MCSVSQRTYTETSRFEHPWTPHRNIFATNSLNIGSGLKKSCLLFGNMRVFECGWKIPERNGEVMAGGSTDLQRHGGPSHCDERPGYPGYPGCVEADLDVIFLGHFAEIHMRST